MRDIWKLAAMLSRQVRLELPGTSLARIYYAADMIYAVVQ
jgi:hypothetical protein